MWSTALSILSIIGILARRWYSTSEQGPSLQTSKKQEPDANSEPSNIGHSQDTGPSDPVPLYEQVEAHVIPSDIRQLMRQDLSRTAKTTRFHIIEMDVFSARYSSSDATPGESNLLDTGIYRAMKVPENYSLVHLGALACFLLGWPCDAVYQITVRDRGKKRRSGVLNVEVWYHLSNEDPEIQDPCPPRVRCNAKLVEVWNPYGLLSTRLRQFTEAPQQQLTSGLSVRVKCVAASVHNPVFPIDEPFGIEGYGAPPAEHLPRLHGSRRRLQERCETKRFDGWLFAQNFWDYVNGEVVSEVDVEGIHVWRVNSDEYRERLDVLERRASGDWLTDIEEFAVEFED